MTAVLRLARRAVPFELALWRALYRWLRRRPDVPADAEPFPYASAVTPVIWVFVVVSAIEVVVVHVVVPREAVRLALDVAGVYGVLWMLGLLASSRTAPHVVDGAGLRVRSGVSVDLVLPWEDIAAVRMRRRSVEGSRTVQVQGDGPRRAVSVDLGAGAPHRGRRPGRARTAAARRDGGGAGALASGRASAGVLVPARGAVRLHASPERGP